MNRKLTNRINYILDNWLPPAIRDSKWFYGHIVLKMAVGNANKHYMEFKDKLPYMEESDINQYYTLLADTFMKRDTDLNDKCVKLIKQNVSTSESVLDAATGRGYLTRLMMEMGCKDVTALDIVLPEEQYGNVKYVQGSLTRLPFEDKSFDVVICTHALEHIKDAEQAMQELRRVCRKKLIIVVPCQREYRYTVDLHINFYPYEYCVRNLVGIDASVELVDHDWMCIEKMKTADFDIKK